MRTRRPAVEKVTAALSIGVVLLLAMLVLVIADPSFLTKTLTSTITTTSFAAVETTTQTVTRTIDEGMTTLVTELTTPSGAGVCIDTGPPGPLLLRVLSDSTMAPVAGANVTAINKPLFCSDGYPLDNNVTITFTTGSAEWYSLYGQGADASFSVTIQFAGRSHAFTADLAPEAAKCATLYLPSGRTNVTSAGTFNLTCG